MRFFKAFICFTPLLAIIVLAILGCKYDAAIYNSFKSIFYVFVAISFICIFVISFLLTAFITIILAYKGFLTVFNLPNLKFGKPNQGTSNETEK